MQWSRHRHAPRYLAGLSFAESSFFPIPPDVMLAPMCLAQPAKAMHFALLTTVASVLGGLAGWMIGYFAFDAIEPWLRTSSYWGAYQTAQAWFGRWGFWAVLLAGFSPIPYKVFTIAAGVAAMSLLPFVLASILGRGGRFFKAQKAAMQRIAACRNARIGIYCVAPRRAVKMQNFYRGQGFGQKHNRAAWYKCRQTHTAFPQAAPYTLALL